MAESGITLGKAYVQIMPSAEGISGSISNLLSPEAKEAGNISGSFIGSNLVSKLKGIIEAAGIGKIITDAVNNSVDFDAAMAKASTLFTGTSSEFAKMKESIIDLSSTYGISAESFAESMYNAESASVPMENLTSMLEGSAKLAKAGFTDVDTALTAVAKTMNAYGMVTDDAAKNNENMEKVMRILIQTQNKGITTVGELGQSLAQVTPTASSFAVSFDQVGASLAGMTAQGTPTAQATTQLNSLIAELGKNGTIAAGNLEKAAEGTEYAGMSFKQMMESGATLNDVLAMMQTQADKDNVSLVDMFSSIEAGKAAMSIANSDFTGNLEAMATSADVVGDAYSTMADTVQGKIDVLKETFKNFGIEAAQKALPAVSTALDGVTSSIQTLSTGFQEGGLSGMFSSLFNEVIPNAISGLTEAMPQFFQSGIELINSLASGLVEGIPNFLSNVLPMIVEFTANLRENAGNLVDAGINFMINLAQGIADGLPTLIENIPQIVINICGVINDNLPRILAAGVQIILILGKGIIDSIPTLIANLPLIFEAVAAVWQAIDWVSLGTNLITWIGNGVKAMFTHLPSLLHSIGNNAVAMFKGIPWKEMGTWVITVIGDGIRSLISAIPTLLKTIAQTAWNAFKNNNWLRLGSEIIGGIADGIKNAVGGLVSACVDAARRLVDGVKDFFGIASPSKLMRDEVGQWIPAGIAVGIEDNMGQVQDAMTDINTQLSGQVQGTYASGYGSLGYTQSITINAPTELDPSEIARQTRNATREYILAMKGV